MARSVKQIIEDLKGKPFDPRMQHIQASYRFGIEGTGNYRIEVDHGKLSVREDAAPADCVIVCSADDFIRLAEGKANFLTAFMQGRVKIEGDLALAKLLHGLVPGAKQEKAQKGGRA